jgi:hypothetical protein
MFGTVEVDVFDGNRLPALIEGPSEEKSSDVFTQVSAKAREQSRSKASVTEGGKKVKKGKTPAKAAVPALPDSMCEPLVRISERACPIEVSSSASRVEPKPIANLHAWFNLRSIMVPKANPEAFEWGLKKGLPVKTAEMDFNGHPVSAMCREAATLQVLKKVARTLDDPRKMKVLDVFGSGRTLSFDPRKSSLSVPVVGGGRSNKKFAVEIVAAPNTEIGGDLARGSFVRVPMPNVKDFDVAIFVDIYQSGATWEQALTTEFVKECLGKVKTKTGYWIGRTFDGLAGADVFEGCAVEQVFYKKDGMVYSSPDSCTETPYPAHPWPEWMHERRIDSLDISPVSRVGPYKIMRITVASNNAQPIGPIDRSGVERVILMPVKQTTVSRLFGLPLSVKTTEVGVPCHIGAYSHFGDAFRGHVSNGQSHDSCGNAVKKYLEEDKAMASLGSRFPLAYSNILKGTIEALIYSGRPEANRRSYMLRRTHHEEEQLLIAARAAKTDFSGFSSDLKWRTHMIRRFVCLFSLANAVFFAIWLQHPVAYVAVGLVVLITLVCEKLGGDAMYVKGAVYERFPVCSAILEEAGCYMFPLIRVAIVLFESARGYYRHDGKLLSTVCLHAVLGMLWYLPGGVIPALFVHMGINAVVARQERKKEIKLINFLSLYEQGRTIDEVDSFTCVMPISTVLPSYTSCIKTGPEKFRGKIKIRVDGLAVTIEEAFALLEEGGKNETYPILVTNRLLHQPANNEINLLAAVLHRIHNDPFVDCVYNEVERHKAWKKISLEVCKMLPLFRTASCTIMENIEAMGKKGERLLRAYNEETEGYFQFAGKTINLKWNETLSVNKEVAGVQTMKPRAIQNLPPQIHAKMGGYAREFASELHKAFDGRVHNIYGVGVRIFFASGYTQAQLSEIGVALSNGEVVFAMSGDDSVVGWGYLASKYGTGQFGEADQSKFDHTQDDGPMKVYMRPILEQMGFPKEFIEMAYQCCASGYSIKRGRLRVTGEAGVQMPTGITTTTTFNSLSTLGFFVNMLRKMVVQGCSFAPKLFGQQVGFDVKYFPTNYFTQATFLKGWWQNGKDGVQWVPLPSAVIKLGKVLKSPLEITKFVRRGKKMHRSPQEAVDMCAFALASSYGKIDQDYPILGAFCGALERAGDIRGLTCGNLQESWKPRMGGISVDRVAAMEEMCWRYGITVEDIVRVEKLLNSIRKLPAYVEDPVFDKLCSKDY